MNENEEHHLDPLEKLPPELAELDAELLRLDIRERPSFAPELEVELERAWAEGVDVASSPRKRRRTRAVAAVIAGGVALVTLSVPPARASLAELSRQALESFGVVEERPEPVLPATLSSDPPAQPLPPLPEEPVITPSSDETPPDAGSAEIRPAAVDPEARRIAVRRRYPIDFRSRGIGGVVGVLARVDAFGVLRDARVARTSGWAELDRAALLAVGDMTFTAGTRAGEPDETVVRIDVAFDPPTLLRTGEGVDQDRWSTDDVNAPPPSEASEALLASVLEDFAFESAGPVGNVLTGEPPDGVGPIGWRAYVTDALERSMNARPDEPVLYLALGRLLRKQGLPEAALRLFEQGLARLDPDDLSRRAVAADLHYEIGMQAKRAWLAWRDVGIVRPGRAPRGTAPFGGALCSGMGVADARPGPELLIALNFACPGMADAWVEEAFEPTRSDEDHRGAMIASFEAAISADPGHVRANRELLLALADTGAWERVRGRAATFERASGGHPHAHLFLGIALQRLGRSEEALGHFDVAEALLPLEQAAPLRDPTPLMSSAERRVFESRIVEDWSRNDAIRAFWTPLDPILSTPVNERRVEHIARAAHALLRFGSTQSDPGLLWVRYGPPHAVRTLGVDSELRTEFWDYGEAPHFTFRRPAMSEGLEFTPETSAFVKDLENSRPQAFDPVVRRVDDLAVHPLRFRSPEGSSVWLLQVHVPEAISTEGGGELQLGVYPFDHHGRLREPAIHRVTGREVTLRYPADRDVAKIVVEIWDAEAGRAGQATVTVGPVPESFRSTASDLLLLHVVDLRHRAVSVWDDWVRPRTGDAVSEERLGAMFELYELGADDYTIEVVARGSDGSAKRLPTRPAGERVFRDSWRRDAETHEGRVVEYLTIDVSPLTPGAHRLVVEVIPATGARALVLERRIRKVEEEPAARGR